MSNHLDELRTARKEGRPQHLSNTSNKNPDRFLELRTARREGGLLQQPNISKKRDGTTEETHPRSRYRRPIPHQVEYHRPEGVAELYPKGDSPLVDDLRRRVRSSPPPWTRGPTSHPSASAPRITKKTVRWADPLEQPTPQRIRSEKRRDSEKPKNNETQTPAEGQPCTLRRYRASSIPRPKRRGSGAQLTKPSCSDRRQTPSFTIQLVLAPQAGQSPRRPLSPLIPQAMPAPLRISPLKSSTRRTANTIPPSVSAREFQAKPPTRSFSFEDQPEVITLSPGRCPSYQKHAPSSIQEKLSSSQPATTFLKEKPKRRGTVRPTQSDAKPASAAGKTESNTPSLSSSSSTSSFHTAKSFWSEISDSSKDRDSSTSKCPSGSSDVTLAVGHASRSPSKAVISKIPSPSSASNSTFDAVKSFWSEISSSSSCGAIIDGAKDAKFPCGPSAISGRTEVCRTSKVAELSRYTVNGPVMGNVRNSIFRIPISRSESGCVGRDRPKSRIPVPSTLSYHVTKTQQSRYVPLRAVSGVAASRFQSSLKSPAGGGSTMSGSASSLSYRTAQSHPSVGSDSASPKAKSTAITATVIPSNDSVQHENTPSLQQQLWHDVLKLCSSESSSCLPDCDCDDCIWSRQDDLDRCSTVAHVDDGESRER
ncbi:uncharacterized protein B0T23DRAFT_412139 [Neurospora hispaniola]|uniref:Uncharacterized protein n=1 Tax=Neurospora hispaniola TaxID=588809 RepID=A0AAJ0MT19_9PEZI|nr:hypothetical protein B0T23DRAFT_412139 [Neurospora hispaniola]